MDHYSRTECETSGKYAPCKISIMRAGRGIMVAGWPLVFLAGAGPFFESFYDLGLKKRGSCPESRVGLLSESDKYIM